MMAAAPGRVNRRSGPIFVMRVKCDSANSKGVDSASSILFGARVRIQFPDLRPRRERVACGSDLRYRYRARPRKRTPDQEAAIRALATTKSLRLLAAEFRVSRETIRAVLRGTTRHADAIRCSGG